MRTWIEPVSPRPEVQGTPSLKWIQPSQRIQEAYSPYLSDESNLSGGKADYLAFPHSESQLCEVVRFARENQIPITISSGRTGIVGGGVPLGGLLISMENYNQVLTIHRDSSTGFWRVRVQPGLSLEKISAIHELVPEDIAFSELEQFFYPPDPTEKSAHLGGNVATNASGARSFFYGSTRKYISALRVVLSDGMVLEIPRGEYVAFTEPEFAICTGNSIQKIPLPRYSFPSVKNVAGYWSSRPYDFIDLFIGSEGTLGIISEVEILLVPKSECIFGAVAFFSSESEAIGFVKKVKEEAKTPFGQLTAVEFFDAYGLYLIRHQGKAGNERLSRYVSSIPNHANSAVYVEWNTTKNTRDSLLSHFETHLKTFGSSLDNAWGGMEPFELKEFYEFRHMLPEIINRLIAYRKQTCPTLHKVGTDFVVPEDAFDAMFRAYRELIDKANLEYTLFGHIGENHVHVNILPRNEPELHTAKQLYMTLAQLAVQYKGSISGEHGIGKLKKHLLRLMYDENALQQMKQVKISLDPLGLLGVGTLFE